MRIAFRVKNAVFSHSFLASTKLYIQVFLVRNQNNTKHTKALHPFQKNKTTKVHGNKIRINTYFISGLCSLYLQSY